MKLSTKHFSFTVSNLARSIHFYQEILGMELVRTQERTGPDISKTVGCDNAHLKIAFLKLPEAGSLLLELVEYVSPKKQIARTTANGIPTGDVGAAHICFSVDDIWSAYEGLRSQGVRFRSEPVQIAMGIYKGSYAAYFLDPDGITLELAQYRS